MGMAEAAGNDDNKGGTGQGTQGQGGGAGSGQGQQGAGQGQQGAGQGQQGSGQGTAPVDWAALRKELAAGDEKKEALLNRYATVGDFNNAHFALLQRMSSGELKATKPFPDKGSDADKAAWRAERGVPETPDKYDIKLPDGQVLGEADKPNLEAFKSAMHAANAPPETVQAGVAWWMNAKEEAVKRNADDLAQRTKETEDTLRSSWGSDYRANMNMIDNYLNATVGTDDADMREAFDRSLKTNPKFANWLANTVRQANPTSTLSGLEAGASVDTVDTELAKLKEMMVKNRPAWNKDEKAQARYQALLDAKARMTSQNKAA